MEIEVGGVGGQDLIEIFLFLSPTLRGKEI